MGSVSGKRLGTVKLGRQQTCKWGLPLITTLQLGLKRATPLLPPLPTLRNPTSLSGPYEFTMFVTSPFPPAPCRHLYPPHPLQLTVHDHSQIVSAAGGGQGQGDGLGGA
jgi:hypothetical protein